MNPANELTLGPATLAAFVSFAMLAAAQQQAPPLKVTKIKDNVYGAQGGAGSNDTDFNARYPGIVAALTGLPDETMLMASLRSTC